MYIVKENNEDKINKVVEIVAERSKKLAEAIELILALKEDKELSVEDIEQGIDVVDGKKKLTDLIPRQLKGFAPGRREKEAKADIALLGWTDIGWMYPIKRDESAKFAFDFSKCLLNPKRSIRVKLGKSYIDKYWNAPFETDNICVRLVKKEKQERGMLLVRNR